MPYSRTLLFIHSILKVYCFFSISKLCPTLCNSMDCSTPGFSVLHHHSEFAQIHVCWVSDAIQLSYPLSPSSPLALNLSQHQGFFQEAGFLHQVAKVLEISFSTSPSNKYSEFISFRIDCLISVLPKRRSRVFSSNICRNRIMDIKNRLVAAKAGGGWGGVE